MVNQASDSGPQVVGDSEVDLARATWDAVTPVCVALAMLFAAFLLFNQLRASAAMSGSVVMIQIATTAWFVVLAAVGRLPMPAPWLAHATGIAIAGAAAGCTVMVARATGASLAVGVLGVPIIGVFALVLSTPWALAAAAECAAISLVLPPPNLPRLDVVVIVMTSAAVGFAVHLTRTRNHHRVSTLRGKERAAHQARLDATARLAGGLGHDFNNLLTIIGNDAMVVRDEDASAEERAAAAASLDEAVGRAAAVTRQLLAFSRQQLVQPTRVRPAIELPAVERLIRRALPPTVAIEVVIEAEQAMTVDAGQLGQALLNLALNARDAMAAGGRLRLVARDVRIGSSQQVSPRPGEVASPRRPGAYVAISVEDDGAGMDDDTLGHLFEPFFTTKAAGRGTGLGLSMVHGIVHQHGGFIEVRSRLGHGTCFTLFVPAAGGDPAARLPPAAVPGIVPA